MTYNINKIEEYDSTKLTEEILQFNYKDEKNDNINFEEIKEKLK